MIKDDHFCESSDTFDLQKNQTVTQSELADLKLAQKMN